MQNNKDSEPPDGGGTSDNPFSYTSQIMDTDDVGIVIKRFPAQKEFKFNLLKNTTSDQVSTPSVDKQVPGSTSLTSASNNSSSTLQSVDKYSNKYDIKDSGPFIVILESSTQNLGNFHPMSIGKLILQEHKELDNYIHSINMAGKNRVKVTFKSSYHANILLASEILKNKEIKSFIPQYLTKRVGIIRGVDLSLSEEEVKDLITPLQGQYFTIVDVTRMKRKIVNEGKDPEYKPTGTMKISFKGQQLPSCISICKVICEVEPFVQRVVQCFNCLRYGHVSAQCRSKVKCAKCGNEHSSTECTSTSKPSCIFCNGDHSSSDRKVCPEFKKQKNIKTIMAIENISYRDATNKVNNSFSNIVQSTIRCTPDEFPSLYESRKRKKITPTKNTFHSVDNYQDHSGNGVCLVSNNENTSINNILPSIINKLVNAIMQLHKEKNLNITQCESTIKNIFMPLIDTNKSNKQSL